MFPICLRPNRIYLMFKQINKNLRHKTKLTKSHSQTISCLKTIDKHVFDNKTNRETAYTDLPHNVNKQVLAWSI